MPRHRKDSAEKLDTGLTVLFTKDEHAALKEMARAHGISMGEVVRRQVLPAIRTQRA